MRQPEIARLAAAVRPRPKWWRLEALDEANPHLTAFPLVRIKT